MELTLQILGLAALAYGLCECNQTERFESVCQIIRRDVVEEDGEGVPQTVDVELEWDPCPGDQFQVIRGGKEFAACMRRYEIGQLVPVLVRHWWDRRGYYVWDVYKVGDCNRQIEPHSEGSYEKSQDCTDELNFGRYIGFSCSRRPFGKLLAACPWMAR